MKTIIALSFLLAVATADTCTDCTVIASTFLKRCFSLYDTVPPLGAGLRHRSPPGVGAQPGRAGRDHGQRTLPPSRERRWVWGAASQLLGVHRSRSLASLLCTWGHSTAMAKIGTAFNLGFFRQTGCVQGSAKHPRTMPWPVTSAWPGSWRPRSSCLTPRPSTTWSSSSLQWFAPPLMTIDAPLLLTPSSGWVFPCLLLGLTHQNCQRLEISFEYHQQHLTMLGFDIDGKRKFVNINFIMQVCNAAVAGTCSARKSFFPRIPKF